MKGRMIFKFSRFFLSLLHENRIKRKRWITGAYTLDACYRSRYLGSQFVLQPALAERNTSRVGRIRIQDQPHCHDNANRLCPRLAVHCTVRRPVPPEEDYSDELHSTDIFAHRHSRRTQHLHNLGSVVRYRRLLHDTANLRTDSPLFSRPENKGRNVGVVISGLLTGILASRVISGFVGEVLGWREMYFIAAGMMLLCAIAALKVLPDIRPTFQGKYSDLMKSLFSLIKDYPALRIYSIRAGVAFGSFLAMWSCLAFKMGEAPFYANSDVIGILGLCGIAGALTASFVGKYVKKVGIRNFNFMGCGLFLLAWASLYFCGSTYAGIIAGVILIDIGMQCIQLSNQTSIFDICPSASNRVNTIFMTTYFIGGSLGTFLAGSCWQAWGWAGVAGIGTTLTMLSLLITIYNKEK